MQMLRNIGTGKRTSMVGGAVVCLLLVGTLFTDDDGSFGYDSASSAWDDSQYTTPSGSQPSGDWDQPTQTDAGSAVDLDGDALASTAAPIATPSLVGSPPPTPPTAGPASSGAPDGGFSSDFSSLSPDASNGSTRHFYVAISGAKAVEPFVEVPRELRQGIGFTENRISALPVECEAMGGMYWLGDEVEEAVLGQGAAPPDAGEATLDYKNEGLARAQNPEGSRGGTSDTWDATETGQEEGASADSAEQSPVPVPSAEASCENPQSAFATSRFTGGELVPGALNASGVLSDSRTRLNETEAEIESEMVSVLVDVAAGPVTIGTLVSFLRVDFPADGGEPTVDYRITIKDVANAGEPLAAFGSGGVTLAGQEVAGSEVVDDFNAQVEENGAALDQLAALGFTVVAPRTFQNMSRWGIDAPALWARAAPQPAQGGVGHGQGLRLGTASFQAQYNTDG